MATTPLALAILLSLLAATSLAAKLTTPEDLGLPASTDTLVKQMASCSCSPSRRGFNPRDAQNLQLVLKHVRQIFDVAEPKLGTRIAKLAAYLYGISTFKQCIRRHGYEACVNADAALRAPGYATFCTYDSISESNLYFSKGNYTVTPPCDTMKRFSSTKAQRGGDDIVFRSTPPPMPKDPLPVLPALTPSPTPKPSTPAALPLAHGNGDRVGKSGEGETGKNVTHRHPDVLPITLFPSRPPIERASPSPTPSTSASNTPAAVPVDAGSDVEGESEGKNKTTHRNEGCVAVEHLHGFVLQHRQHLMRSVLCAYGFCATPNHGIVVDGVYTSMKRLCDSGTWACTVDVKLVNNLKISSNRRANYGTRIVITPYDVRFPVPLLWAVQMLEDMWSLVSTSVMAGLVLATLFVLHSKVWIPLQRHGIKRRRDLRSNAEGEVRRGWILLESQLRL